MVGERGGGVHRGGGDGDVRVIIIIIVEPEPEESEERSRLALEKGNNFECSTQRCKIVCASVGVRFGVISCNGILLERHKMKTTSIIIYITQTIM